MGKEQLSMRPRSEGTKSAEEDYDRALYLAALAISIVLALLFLALGILLEELTAALLGVVITLGWWVPYWIRGTTPRPKRRLDRKQVVLSLVTMLVVVAVFAVGCLLVAILFY